MTTNPFAAWFPGWAGGRQEPLSGDVSQWFRIFSPTVTVTGRGEPELEARIVRDVATYGAQLAPITDLVLALAEGKDPPAEALAKLQTIRRDVQEAKDEFRKGVKARARRALEDLKQDDPEALADLIAEFRAGHPPEIRADGPPVDR
jgi:hypothetical protein